MNSLSNNKTVRNLFEEDLKGIASQGVCLLPEWICSSMSDAVRRAEWVPKFYPVERMDSSNGLPFCVSKSTFMKLIHEMDDTMPMAVVFAFACGYLDCNVIECIKYCKLVRKNTSILLDLAQGYGLVDFTSLIGVADKTYFSFNANKLISTGGALRVDNKMIKDYRKLLPVFMAKSREAFLGEINHFQELDRKYSICKYRALREEPLLVRSNPHRTVVLGLDDQLKALLEEKGHGQTMHPSPQGAFEEVSDNYRYNYKNTFLIFNRQRN